MNIGVVYYSLNDYTGSIDVLEKALAIFREIQDYYDEGAALNNLANSFAALGGNSERAVNFYQQALEIARETGNQRGEANALANLSARHHKDGDTPGAIVLAEEALEIFVRIEDPAAKAVVNQLAGWRALRTDRQ